MRPTFKPTQDQPEPEQEPGQEQPYTRADYDEETESWCTALGGAGAAAADVEAFRQRRDDGYHEGATRSTMEQILPLVPVAAVRAFATDHRRTLLDVEGARGELVDVVRENLRVLTDHLNQRKA